MSTSTDSKHFSGITSEMIDRYKPDNLKKIGEGDGKSHYTYIINIDDDELIIDCIDGTLGDFVAEELIDQKELRIEVNDQAQYLEWSVTIPELEEPVRKRYNFPQDTANAIRFLQSYMELDIDLPFVPVILQDNVDLTSEGITLNNQPMVLLYPKTTSLIAIEFAKNQSKMGKLLYTDLKGNKQVVFIDDIVLKH